MVLSQAIVLIEQYKYLVLFPLAVLEGPVITVVAGFLVTMGVLDALAVYAIVVLGDIVGDSVWYALGRFGRGRLLLCLERLFRITPDKIERAKRAIEKHSLRTMAVAKLSHGVGFAALIAAGMIGMSIPRFVAACLIVALGQAVLFLTLGVWFGRAYETIGSYTNYFAAGTVVVGICGLAFMTWHLMHKFRKAA